ncbi:MAG: DNA-binding protein [Erysipelotrichaceae bacterium]|nr:DNA-binding protein [Erysipelotrichaceae bacterium]
MREYAERLTENTDLKEAILRIAKENHIESGVVLCGVGCLKEVHIRKAGAKETFHSQGHYEIVSLMGTIATGKVHIHISLSDEEMNTIGGHLLSGCIVDTTCELVLGILEEYELSREFDTNTGYDELVARKI